MILRSLVLINFRSFTGRQEFTFPSSPGLYFMQGQNLAEPRLEANGSGKSTIWEALLWCLYGKTSRGLKAGDVCNWTAGKKCTVVLCFHATLDGVSDSYFLTRTWNPNTWTLKGLFGSSFDLAKDASNPMLAELRLTFSSFLNCILTAQNQPMFIDQKADTKAAIFSEVLQLDTWLAHSESASRKASKRDAANRKLEWEVAGLRGQLDELSRNVIHGDSKAWEAERERRVAELDNKHHAASELLRGIKDKQAAASQRLMDARESAERVAKELGDLTSWARQSDRDIQKLETSILEAGAKIERLQITVDQLQHKKACPTCGQEIDAKERAKMLAEAQERLEDTQQHREKLRVQLGVKIKHQREDLEAVKECEEIAASAGYKVDDARGESDRLQHQRAYASADVESLEREVAAVLREVNPFLEQERKRVEAVARIQADLSAAERELDHGRYVHSLCSFWVRGFKDLRLHQIAEALSELEVEVNSCVESLGLVGWEIGFQVDRETKSGTIQRGFSVTVKSPHNAAPVPWEAWSGGEAQRLRIATTMGFSNLIRARTGTTLNLEVWDEPTQGLSAQGVQDLLESLASRAQIEGRQIWVVDHRSRDFGNFAGGAMITKTESGSTIQQHN